MFENEGKRWKKLCLLEEHLHNKNVRKYRIIVSIVSVGLIATLIFFFAPVVMGYKVVFVNKNAKTISLLPDECKFLTDKKITAKKRLKKVLDKLSKKKKKNIRRKKPAKK